jgi:thiosulfate dehydrogenase [quinone] large subunit
MTTTTSASATPVETTASAAGQPVTSLAARRALAVCRILLAGIFLWAPLDKIFGLGYATTPDQAWIAGSSPTTGYLTHLESPPADFFAALASPVTDALFIAGMLGTGLALLLGIGLRVAAVAGGLIMTMLYLSAWNFAAGSNNPVVDAHLIYVALLAALALTKAGDTWGLGRVWASSGIPGTSTWMR